MTTPIYAIGYARVSSVKQAVEGDSLENQATIIGSGITTSGWINFLPEVLKEPFTGSTDDRRIYRYALDVIKKNPGKIKYFVIRSLDRFSREGSRRYQEMKEELASLGVELRDTAQVIQPKVSGLAHLGFEYPWSVRSPSAVSEAALSQVHNEQRGAILEQLIGAEIRLVQAGYHVGRADDGYLARRISVDGKKRLALFPDPERASFYQRMFELRADGSLTDKEIAATINAMGFRTQGRNRWSADRTKVIGHLPGVPLTDKHLQEIIRRPRYAGIVCKRWTHWKPIRAQGGEPLISVDLFNLANRGMRFIDERPDGSLFLLYNRQLTPLKAKRHKFRSVFPFKNIVACPICKKPLVASFTRGRKGGRYGAYHCARKHPRYAVARNVLESNLRAYLAELRPLGGTWDRTQEVLKTLFQQAQADSVAIEDVARRSVRSLEERKDQLVEAFTVTTSPLIRSDLERKIEAIGENIRQSENLRLATIAPADDLGDFLALAREIVEHPGETLANAANIQEQLTLSGLFFERRPTYPEIVSRTAQLTPLFKAVESSAMANSESVHTLNFTWNTIHQEMRRWNDTRVVIAPVLARMAAKRNEGEVSNMTGSLSPSSANIPADVDQLENTSDAKAA